MLGETGYNQREIGRMVGNRQSEVCDIRRRRRRVTNYDVLVRNATGLGIPRALMGLAWSDGGYPGKVTVAEPLEGVSAEMLRRHLLAFGAVTAFGAPIKGLDEFLDELPDPGAVQAPSHLDRIHVAEIQDLTRRLGDALKMLQCGQVKAWKIPNDQERAVTVGVIGRAAVEAELLASCAMARADLGHLVDAERDMATARDIWRHPKTIPFERFTGRIQLAINKL